MNPGLSVITINYNGMGFTLDCLRSLEKQSFKDFEVVVVDNGSSDGSAEAVERYLRESPLAGRAKFIPSGRNLGFAGGNNEGLRHASGECIVLLNNDAEADSRFLAELWLAASEHPEAGICAAKLIVHGSDVIDSAGDGFSNSLKGFKRGEGDRSASHGEQEYVFGACAGAALYRRRMLDEIGFLDEDFFINLEDVDMSFRAQLAGWKVLFVPTARVSHKVSTTIRTKSNTQAYYSLRNSEYVRFKNVPLGVFVRCLPAYLLGMASEFLYFAVRLGKFRLFFKAKLDAARGLPRLLGKRRRIMSMKKVSDRYILHMMTPFTEKNFFRKKFRKFIHG